MIGLLESGAEAEKGRIFFFNIDVYGLPLIVSPMFLPVLLFIDWLALVILRGRRRQPEFVRA